MYDGYQVCSLMIKFVGYAFPRSKSVWRQLQTIDRACKLPNQGHWGRALVLFGTEGFWIERMRIS